MGGRDPIEITLYELARIPDHFKVELCGRLSALRQSHVDHIVRSWRRVLSLDWHEWISCNGKG